MIDLTGRVFNKLTVVEFIGNRKGINYWKCLCSCGNTIDVRASSLKEGGTGSCGCLKDKGAPKHGHCSRTYKSPEYVSWSNMKSRCYGVNNPKYEHYGGRGITVCSKWLDKEHGFENFLEDMGPRPKGMTLDRIDINGNYNIDNCKWSTVKEQNNNKRNSILRTHNGITSTVTQWAGELHIRPATLQRRIDIGMSEDDIFHEGSLIVKSGKKDRHGARDRLDRILEKMKSRCFNPKDDSYKLYGGRGISICQDWMDKSNFKSWAIANGYEKSLTLDRIDCNGNYTPENCKWSTRKEQGRNRRPNVYYEYGGKTICETELAEKLGITNGALRARRLVNMPDEKLFHVGHLKSGVEPRRCQ